MNDCAIDFSSGSGEVEATGLKTLPSIDVAVPRLAAAPFALECRQHVALAFRAGRLFGNLCAAQRDTFALTRESHEQWLARNGAAEMSDQSQ